MMIKFNSEELKQARKELVKDISIQQIRKALNEEVNRVISEKIESHIKNLSSWNSMEKKVNEAITKVVEKIIRQRGFTEALKLQEVTKEDIIKRVDINKIERDVRTDLRKKLLETLNKQF